MRAENLFWSIALLYLLLAFLSKFIFPELGRPGLLPLAYALAFLASMALGFFISERIPEKVRGTTYLSLFSAVLLATSPVIFLISLPMFFLLAFFVLCESYTLLKKSLYALGITLLILLPLSGVFLAGVPIMEPASRFSRFRFLYLASGYVVVVLLSAKPDWRVLLWGITIGIISTFRTVVLGVALAYTFGLLLERKRPRPGPLIAITLGLALALVVRYHATLSSYSTWHLGIAESILYRPGVTYTVYERLFNLGFPWGKGWILISSNPKLYVGHLFGRDVGYTYTLFGQPAYDLGLLGPVEGLILGMALRDSIRMKETTVMGLTLLSLAVPIGLDAFFFSALMAIASIPTEVVSCRTRRLCQ
ncbi:hypothetical protein [Thermococcus sp.]|uniref:hypothetical protein n=1 Tax=Thermococcus sp. TaxID=35749 RepID=UPI0026157B2A|nr:hypothetical protein [Thermococcus sp.]